MSEELLNDALRGVMETVRETKDFVLEQAPEIVQQLVTYHYIYSLCCVLAGVLFILLSVSLIGYGVFNGIKCRWDDKKCEKYLPFIIIGCIASVPGIATFFVNLPYFLKVSLAPKVFILEYFARMI